MATYLSKSRCGLSQSWFDHNRTAPLKRTARRRGVILLVLLGMLALFGATAFAFLVIASHGNRAARSLQKVDRVASSAQQDLEEAMYQVVRGSNNNTSVLRGHSLLDDVYGNGSLNGWVINGYTLEPLSGPGSHTAKELPGNVLPGVATPPANHQSRWGLGQIIEFTVGYTIPSGGPTGGLHRLTGLPVGMGQFAANTWTVPEWYGSRLRNIGGDNEPFEFQRRVGCVLTITDHRISRRFGLANKSTRIIGYHRVEVRTPPTDPNPNVLQLVYHRYQILPFEGVTVDDTIAYLGDTGRDLAEIPKDEHRADFVINGTPFSGTGAGYNHASGTNDAGYTNVQPFALLPNPTDPAYHANIGWLMANEDYDAADFQNMLLAMQMPGGIVLSPSLHRPELAAYWFQQVGMGPQWLDLKRRFMLRPLKEDHPNFDGSNDAYAASDPATVDWETSGPWDVDNDGDGVPDSIWVDLGLPARSLPDGRKYKPLAAILCVDLDGRINLNTAGSVEQLHDAYRAPLAAALPKGYLADNTVYAQGMNQGTPPGTTPDLSRGQGCGSAEVSLLPVLAAQQAIYRNLLLGMPARGLDGRYGEVNTRGADPEFHEPSPGLTFGVDSPEQLMVNRLFGFPTNYFQAVTTGAATGYGSPMDLKGTLAIGLDFFGQPIYSALRGVPTSLDASAYVNGWNGPTWDFARYDTPYELKLGKIVPQSVGLTAALDSPFTVAELEPLLRRYDADILHLPARLRLLLDAGPNSPYRFQATTESWDLPVPNLALSKELQDGWDAIWQAVAPTQPPRPAQHVTDLVAARIASLANDPAPGGLIRLTAADALRVGASSMLCSDVLLGMRMDLNRPFGDGQDNDGNNVVDELLESGGLSYRYEYAKTLYVLMMALVDKDWYPVWDGAIARELEAGNDPNNSPTLVAMARARAIAQWAVNVVDFRDSDSVMTPFEYDIYPFHANRPWQPGEAISTWDVDGDIFDPRNIPDPPTTPPTYDPTWEPTRGVVWGCERPELLITETFATHDRRQYNVAPPAVPPAPQQYEYVNKFRPEGSLFVELYNPWTDAEPAPPEFYRDFAAGINAVGVRLNQMSARPDTDGNYYPVWRLAIYDLADALTPTKMPDGLGYRDPDDESLATPPTLERLVYFVPDAGTLPEVGKAKATFSTSLTDLAPIRPQRYAVVGPRNLANKETGYSAGATLLGAPPAAIVSQIRRIQLNPDSDPNVTGQVQVFSDGTSDDLATLGSAVQPPVAIVIDKSRAGTGGTLRNLRLSISEPANGYAADADPNYIWQSGYATEMNPPEDVMRTDGWGGTPAVGGWTGPLSVAGVTPALRYVHLQRLADPLRPYHPTTNRYKSIDSAPVDLTVFDSQMDAATHAWCQAETFPAKYAQAGNPLHDCIVTRQRGEEYPEQAKSARFWTALVVPDPTKGQPLGKNVKSLPANPPVPHTFFSIDLGHSLGYLNDFFFNRSPLNSTDFALPAAYGGAPGTEAGASGSMTFTPDPLPWLTWLNRPFANPLELLQVPALHSSRLLLSYENDVTKAPEIYTSGKESFAHLAPFFSAVRKDNQTEKNFGKLRGVTGNDTTLLTTLTPHFYRLLEYVHVPSRFVDSQIQGNPAAMNISGEPHAFHPPFHFIPTYREPGKVNLNTIFDHSDPSGQQPIWQALANDHVVPSWIDFVKTRRGFDLAAGDPDYGFETGTPPLPTRFANPFRSFAGSRLVPSVPGRDAGGTNPPYLSQLVQEGINATLLRAVVDPADPLRPLDQRVPRFTMASAPDPSPFADTAKNPFFQYQSLQRLSNLVTTRSNVYAVWITVGYFEMEPKIGFNPLTQAHIYPEGYTLGQELGIDTGEVKRHRGFYIIDRSIPVGFIPGKNLNAENAVILKRFIE